jgi:hypothetical protein
MKLVNILKEIKVSSPISSGKLKIDHRYRHLSSLSYIRAKDNPGLKLEDKSVDVFSNYVKVYFANSILGGGESYRSDFETFVNYLKRKGIKFTDREETTLLGNHQYWVDIPKSQIEFYNPEIVMNEIKISSPNKSFQVTEKGQNFYDKYDELFDILWLFSVDLDIWNLDDPGDLLVASEFYRYVREDIIKNKGNNSLEDVLKKSDIYGEEPEEIKEHLRSFLSLGLITPFNL